MSRPRNPIWLLAALLALLSTLLLPTLAVAADPERPLTSAELAVGERRIRAAVQYVAAADAELRTASCPIPTGSGPTPQSCPPPSGFLGVEARDQIKAIYCGPAVGQVVSNYTWAMGAARNKYTQGQIAAWMRTDINGGTAAPELEDGLEQSTIRSPRRPQNWDWVVINLLDRNHDGQEGDELHGYVRSNVSGSRMPLALPVKPHEPGAQFWLVSWPLPKPSVGHWIAVYGWKHLWQGGDLARTYYTDSSKDEGGGTGKYSDPTRHLAEMIMLHTRRLVW
jgi:hypothetical protein